MIVIFLSKLPSDVIEVTFEARQYYCHVYLETIKC